MSLFNFGKKKEEAACSCGGNCNPPQEATAAGCGCDSPSPTPTAPADSANAAIKVLGPGCKKCQDLEKSVIEAIAKLNLNEGFEHVTDFAAIARYGVMNTPALVIDGKVVSVGKVLKTDEVIALINKARG